MIGQTEWTMLRHFSSFRLTGLIRDIAVLWTCKQNKKIVYCHFPYHAGNTILFKPLPYLLKLRRHASAFHFCASRRMVSRETTPHDLCTLLPFRLVVRDASTRVLDGIYTEWYALKNGWQMLAVGIETDLEASDTGCCNYIIWETVPVCHNSLW